MNISTEYVVNTMQALQTKWYMGVGAVAGSSHKLLETHGTDLYLTILYGFLGALGAGLFKLIVMLASKAFKKKENDPVE